MKVDNQTQAQKEHIYILHFDKPYWGNCQHYVGYTKDLDARLAKHRAGNGSRLVRYAISKGCTFTVVSVETYPTHSEARERERRIKKRGGGGKLCPLCREGR